MSSTIRATVTDGSDTHPAGLSLTIDDALRALAAREVSEIRLDDAARPGISVDVTRTVQPARWRVSVRRGAAITHHDPRSTAREAVDEATAILCGQS